MKGKSMGRPSSEAPKDVRQALLAATLELLEEEGDALSLREVARRVGVSHPAAYHHFSSKEALLASAATRGFQQLDTAMEAASLAADPEPLARFVALGLAYVRFALDHPRLFRVMFRAETHASDTASDVRAAADRSFLRVHAAIAAATADVPNAPDSHATTVLAWSAMHGLALLWIDGPLAAWSGEKTLEPTVEKVGLLIARLLFQTGPGL